MVGKGGAAKSSPRKRRISILDLQSTGGVSRTDPRRQEGRLPS